MPLLPSVVASMVCCVLCCGLLCVLAVCSCCLCVFLVAVCAVCDVLAWLLCVCCLFLGCCPHGLSACLCGLFLFLKKNNKKNGQKGKRLPRYGSTFALLRLAEISSAYNLNPLSVPSSALQYYLYVSLVLGTVQQVYVSTAQ